LKGTTFYLTQFTYEKKTALVLLLEKKTKNNLKIFSTKIN